MNADQVAKCIDALIEARIRVLETRLVATDWGYAESKAQKAADAAYADLLRALDRGP